MDGLAGGFVGAVRAQRRAGVVVDVKSGPVAAGYVDSDAVASREDVRRRVELEH